MIWLVRVWLCKEMCVVGGGRGQEEEKKKKKRRRELYLPLLVASSNKAVSTACPGK